MSWIFHDPDEWETIFESKSYGFVPGTTIPFGSGGISQRRRSPEEVAAIKANKLRLQEDEILRRAEEIKARRDLPTVILTEQP
jgi:hypothetical protein